eukprot:CAMPEP_0197867176 /NCGR_PEP_ID=MMETSP1438-20131217/44617_1 /TAXON_ID=1461541 /ORGANISM="Pterosperma sp., Strain CCMP1384" /LENGTH=183 /DNA_ID=CAMNT_0043485803 /DNA_START=52 /DNA_END=600 /DNA_ORIENTATION=-
MPISEIRPKASLHYYSDGSGRDSYVHKDNGGLKRDKDYTIPTEGGRYGMTMQSNALTDNKKAPTKYYHNGTGRDGYASLGDEKPLDFHEHLRNHPPMDPPVDRITASSSATPESRRAVSRQLASSTRLATSKDYPPGGRIGANKEQVLPRHVRTVSSTMHTGLEGTKSTFVTSSFNQGEGNKW